MDDYHGKFKSYALADSTFGGENTKIIEYADGFTTRNVYFLQVNTFQDFTYEFLNGRSF